MMRIHSHVILEASRNDKPFVSLVWSCRDLNAEPVMTLYLNSRFNLYLVLIGDNKRALLRYQLIKRYAFAQVG